jgi:hypothetical protein
LHFQHGLGRLRKTNIHSCLEYMPMTSPSGGHATGRRSLLALIALPLIVLMAVLAFAWPAARIAPRELPLGIVGTAAAAQAASNPSGSAALPTSAAPTPATLAAQASEAFQHAVPGAFDLTTYRSVAAARQAIEDRDVYGAMVVSPDSVTTLTASAAGVTVSQLLDQAAGTFAHASAAHGRPLTVATQDVVPTSAQDPHGLVLSSALLPLTICGVILGAATALLLGSAPPWRRILALIGLSAAAALGVYAMAQGFLGALPNNPLETWGALALTLFAISSTGAGLISLLGPRGLGLTAALMVFVGNPFSGVTSAPEMLPRAVSEIGRRLPPGAGANLLRSTAYFDGHGAAGHLAVLLVWSAIGLLAMMLGHRRRKASTMAPQRDFTGAAAPGASIGSPA